MRRNVNSSSALARLRRTFGLCVARQLSPLQISGDFGELGEGGFEVFGDLQGDHAGIGRWSRVLTAASFTVGGTETLSVSRETGQLGFLIQGGWCCLRGFRLLARPEFAGSEE